MRLHTILFALLLALPLRAQAPTEGSPVAPAPEGPIAELSVRDAIILGIIEGVTEFLPVSSTGHLIIANNLLGLESTEPLRDSNGEIIWVKPPSDKHPAGVPATVKEAADTYAVVIQIGAIAAVAILFWQRLLDILRGVLGKNAAGLRLLRNIVLALFPCVVIGLLTHEWINENLFSIPAVAGAGIIGAFVMLFAERWRKERGTAANSSRLEPADLSVKQALGIGVMQCFALWPGTSRSMVTMVGGYFCGLSPAKAAEFSFLVGLPTLGGAAALKGYKSGAMAVEVFGLGNFLLGIGVAAVSGALAVKLFVAYLTRSGLTPFALYRIGLAITLLLWYYL